MKKRYVFLIAMIPILICVSSLLWYRSRPQPEPTATPRPKSLATATVPPAKVASRWPSWSPDGKQIAYILIEDAIPAIQVHELETGEQTTIFKDATEIIGLEWSPGGDQIAFNAQLGEENEFQLYTIRPDGTEFQPLTNDERSSAFLTWSPDGQKIVFQIFNQVDKHSLIYMINPDGTNQEFLTKAYNPRYLSFSPDRKRIIYITEGDSVINIKNIETGEDALFSEEEYAVLSWPVWSPDGKWIAYTVHSRLRGEIHLLDPSSREIIELTNMSQEDKMLAWSPDSQTIAFQRSTPPESSMGDIFLIDVDGQNLRQLTDTPFDEYQCLWSPDGEWIAITLEDPMPPFWDIYLIRVDGSGMYRLRDNMPYP
jgi:Tol biopolymer transport system component